MNNVFDAATDPAPIDVLSDPRVLFPQGGSDAKVVMQRIGVLCDCRIIAGKILSWGTGATNPKTLEATIDYYGNFRCKPTESIFAIRDYIASFVPGGLDADLTDFDRDYLRDLMGDCIDTAQGQEDRARRMKRGGVTS